MKPFLVLVLLLASALLSACGSGTQAESVPTRPVAFTAPVRDRPVAQSRPRGAVATTPSPAIVQRHIAYGARRLREMAAYAHRHYGINTYRLTHPKVVVEHYTETSTAKAAIAVFAPDVADGELHELPGVCAHFVIDRDGTIYQLVRVSIMCRHTVGLNYTAIGIEMVGYSDRQILRNSRQLRASLRLTRWLRCRFGISVRNVIGHNESRSSPYHRERVARLRNQTHSDWNRADMNVYRAKLARTGCT